MTYRRTHRRRHHHPLLLIGFALVLFLAVDAVLGVAALLAHLAPLLIVAAVVVLGIRAVRHRNRPAVGQVPPRQVIRATAEHVNPDPGAVERDRLAARVADLERERDEARDSAQAAWDAAADRPPTPRQSEPAEPDAKRSALLADARSGTHPLGRQP